MLSITQDEARLWVDCKSVYDRNGSERIFLNVRGPIDASEGYFAVAKSVQTNQTVPVSTKCK